MVTTCLRRAHSAAGSGAAAPGGSHASGTGPKSGASASFSEATAADAREAGFVGLERVEKAEQAERRLGIPGARGASRAVSRLQGGQLDRGAHEREVAAVDRGQLLADTERTAGGQRADSGLGAARWEGAVGGGLLHFSIGGCTARPDQICVEGVGPGAQDRGGVGAGLGRALSGAAEAVHVLRGDQGGGENSGPTQLAGRQAANCPPRRGGAPACRAPAAPPGTPP